MPLVLHTFVVQLRPSSQLPDVRHVLVGQLLPEPVQYSALSQRPQAGRHTVLEERRALAGQVFTSPSQVSLRSQTPAAARHTVPAGLRATSAGHAVLPPGHTSAGSHRPVAARHGVAAASNPSAGQLTELPVHASAVSHAVPGWAGRHHVAGVPVARLIV